MGENNKELLEYSKKYLYSLSKGAKGFGELEVHTLAGLQVLNSHKGFFLCSFLVPNHLSDQDGNWHAGAIATLIDDVGVATAYSTVGQVMSVDLTVSYYSRVKPKVQFLSSPRSFQEEVDVEAEIVGETGKLICVVVKIKRKKKNGELVALGKQWVSSYSFRPKQSPLVINSRL